MLEFTSRKLKIKFDGQDYEMSYPSVSQVTMFNNDLKEKTEIESTLSFLDKLGLPLEISGKMEVYQIEKIIEEITKKK